MSNTYDGKHLTFEDQIELFEKRGMKFREGKEKAEYKIKFINYYNYISINTGGYFYETGTQRL